MTLAKSEILEQITEILAESFELDRARIRPESSLYEELDLDSIDAVDIFVQIREITGRRPDPAVAKTLMTVQALVEFVEAELAKGPSEDDGQG